MKDKACPNAKCSFYGKTRKGNIVSNGSYFNREGERIRRFRCTNCETSFCDRSSSIFYGLRSSEKKVLMALRLLFKGYSLRRISAYLKIKYETLRSWLQRVVEPNARLDAWLIKETGASKEELRVLREFVKNNSLRQRANVHREK